MRDESPLYIASDHAGFMLKTALIKQFPSLPWKDLGPENTDRVDYPDFAKKVALQVAKNNGRGVLVCGSGQGVAMTANKFIGIRAALCWSKELALLSRQHNDANVLCLGERVMAEQDCFEILTTFLETEFEGGRHAGRVEKINNTV